MGDPLTPPLLLLTKNVFTRCFCNNLYKEKSILGCFIVPPSPTICLKIQFLASYPHMRLLMGNPLTPPPLLLTNFITGCCCNIIFGEETISGCFHPIVPPSSAICLKIQFLAIYPHLRTLMDYPMSFFHFFLTRCVGWNKVLLISSKKFRFFSFFLIFF